MSAHEWGLLGLAALTLALALVLTLALCDRVERRHRERVLRHRFLDRIARGHGGPGQLS